MFGSQALETAIGLALMFFILALGASSIVESISRIFSKRAVDLEKALAVMLTSPGDPSPDTQATQGEETKAESALVLMRKTSVYDAARRAAGKSLFRRRDKKPSYLSAKSFADAAMELAGVAGQLDLSKLPGNLGTRALALKAEFQDDLTAVRAGLETWFDETMERLEGAYRRWVAMLLFVVGLTIAVVGNASAFHVAKDLWRDPVVRQAVVASADEVVRSYTTTTTSVPVTEPTTEPSTASPSTAPPATIPELDSVAETVEATAALGLPIGWDPDDRQVWTDAWDHPSTWQAPAGYVVGWLLTAFLVMLGAPFWFDLLTRLVSLRATGSKPETAANDRSSAVSELARRIESSGPPSRIPARATAPKDGG